VKPDDAYDRMVGEIARGVDALEGREEDIQRPASLIPSDLDTFERIERFCEIVVPMFERRLEASEREWAEIIANHDRGDTTDDLDSDVA
jgi:hypothetical protein